MQLHHDWNHYQPILSAVDESNYGGCLCIPRLNKTFLVRTTSTQGTFLMVDQEGEIEYHMGWIQSPRNLSIAGMTEMSLSVSICERPPSSRRLPRHRPFSTGMFLKGLRNCMAASRGASGVREKLQARYPRPAPERPARHLDAASRSARVKTHRRHVQALSYVDLLRRGRHLIPREHEDGSRSQAAITFAPYILASTKVVPVELVWLCIAVRAVASSVTTMAWAI
ncbi:hypothetical protein B0H13DRAFT_1896570 [Mycena leptocephala]|nr:hypothetical protein B0H13DRAFT_1896570 [Mycena leptocephala]